MLIMMLSFTHSEMHAQCVQVKLISCNYLIKTKMQLLTQTHKKQPGLLRRDDWPVLPENKKGQIRD